MARSLRTDIGKGGWAAGPAAAGLAAVVLLVYLPALSGGLIWDDAHFVMENPLIHARDGLYRFWCTADAPDYFPLTSSMFWFEWRLWGTWLTGYHIINIILHAAGAILLWRTLERLKLPCAWLAALVFAVHPVCVESAAWITERKNTLSQALFFVAMLCYLKEEDGEGRGWYFAALGAFLLALLAKTSVVILPAALLLCAWWRRGRVGGRDLGRAAAFFALALALGLLTLWFSHERALKPTNIPPPPEAMATRVAGAGWAIWFYLYKAVVPIGLTIVYPRWAIDASSPLAYAPLAALIGLFALLWSARRGWGRPALFGLGYFVIALLPTVGLVPMSFLLFSRVADHFQYLAIPGVIALVICPACWFVGERRPAWRGAARGLAVAGALVLALLSWRQAALYADAFSIWGDNLRKNSESWVARTNLGTASMRAGNMSEAEGQFREALRLKPDNLLAHYNLANVLFGGGRMDEAIWHYGEAARLMPGNAVIRANFGNALAARRRYDESERELREALRLNPGLFDALNGYGLVCLRLNRPAQAVGLLRKALEARPESIATRVSLGEALAAAGQPADAAGAYAEALSRARGAGATALAEQIERALKALPQYGAGK